MAVLGTGITILWPKRWIGWAFILIATVLVAGWGYLQFGTSSQPRETAHKKADTNTMTAPLPGPVVYPMAPKPTRPTKSQDAQAPSTSPPQVSSSPGAPALPPDYINLKKESAATHASRSLKSLFDTQYIFPSDQAITILITSANSEYLAYVSGIFDGACRQTPRQCWFASTAGPNDLDAKELVHNTQPGIAIYGPKARYIGAALSQWITTYTSLSLPDWTAHFKDARTKDMIWVDIGPGSPLTENALKAP
jgi:hypothetical protein